MSLNQLKKHFYVPTEEYSCKWEHLFTWSLQKHKTWSCKLKVVLPILNCYLYREIVYDRNCWYLSLIHRTANSLLRFQSQKTYN